METKSKVFRFLYFLGGFALLGITGSLVQLPTPQANDWIVALGLLVMGVGFFYAARSNSGFILTLFEVLYPGYMVFYGQYIGENHPYIIPAWGLPVMATYVVGFTLAYFISLNVGFKYLQRMLKREIP